MLEKRYSGDSSEAFWEIITLIDDDKLSLQELGCELQDLESKVLRKINERISIIDKLKRDHDKRKMPGKVNSMQKQKQILLLHRKAMRYGPQLIDGKLL